MSQHLFIFSPGAWLGEGSIELNMSDEELGFFTKWTVSPPDSEGHIECLQEIQMKGLSETMHNRLVVSGQTPGGFSVQLENEPLGRVVGKGLISDKVIAWEFRIKELGFEGFEFYEKQEDGTYLMRAEFVTSDQFRTLIRGKVWQKAPTTTT